LSNKNPKNQLYFVRQPVIINLLQVFTQKV